MSNTVYLVMRNLFDYDEDDNSIVCAYLYENAAIRHAKKAKERFDELSEIYYKCFRKDITEKNEYDLELHFNAFSSNSNKESVVYYVKQVKLRNFCPGDTIEYYLPGREEVQRD